MILNLAIHYFHLIQLKGAYLPFHTKNIELVKFQEGYGFYAYMNIIKMPSFNLLLIKIDVKMDVMLF